MQSAIKRCRRQKLAIVRYSRESFGIVNLYHPIHDLDSKLPISQKYAYLAALVLTLLMVLQSTDVEAGQFQINLTRVLLFACNYLTWAFGLNLVHRFTHQINLSLTSWKTELGKWIIMALVIAGIQLLISNALYYIILALISDFSFDRMVSGFANVWIRAYASRMIDFIVIVGVLRALSNYRKLNEQQLAVAELEAMLTQTRLEALKMQLNPHFLFNALHAIHSMIGYDNGKARSMLLKISNLLRKILELGEKQLISLSDELNYLKDYLDIEQERFHDRLVVEYVIQDDLLTAFVPSLILQPLAENALKHGISPMEGPGRILLTIQNGKTDEMEIVMKNSMNQQAQKPVYSMGIGLSNLEKRLEQLYQKNFQLDVFSQDAAFVVQITIPLEYED